MSTAATTPAEAPAPEILPTVIPRERLEEKEITTGPVMRLTLPGDTTISEGEQNIHLFSEVGELLHRDQWIEISNDGGSFWAMARVAEIHGTRSTGCRGLNLQFIMGPKVSDRSFEKPAPTGAWYTRWMGAHQKWCVISPTGVIFKSGLMTESEAQGHVFGRMSSSRPL